MCGIVGVISNNKINTAKLRSVSTIIAHRGPDDEGILLFDFIAGKYHSFRGQDTISDIHYPLLNEDLNNNSAFLHRRLSIIDLTKTGHQPMSYDSGNLWIVYNGEIYNHIELREELKKRGYKFKITSDTEVILASYQQWGSDCVKRFKCMWAFAIWGRRDNLIFLSRDGVGIKPLYYYYQDENFIFCSKIKGIRIYLDNKLTFSEKKIYQYLIRGQIIVGESEETIYEEVKQLMPGTNLIFNKSKILNRKYWSLKLTKNRFSFNENVEKFKELFYQTI